ncbi:MAG: hypothetical protein WED33_10255, partial [Bacteroidia bacterium]
ADIKKSTNSEGIGDLEVFETLKTVVQRRATKSPFGLAGVASYHVARSTRPRVNLEPSHELDER